MNSALRKKEGLCLPEEGLTHKRAQTIVKIEILGGKSIRGQTLRPLEADTSLRLKGGAFLFSTYHINQTFKSLTA